MHPFFFQLAPSEDRDILPFSGIVCNLISPLSLGQEKAISESLGNANYAI